MTEDYDATHLPGLGSYPVETQLYRSSDMNHCLAFGRRTVVLAGKKLGSLRYEVGLLLGDLQGLRRSQSLRLVDLLFHRQPVHLSNHSQALSQPGILGQRGRQSFREPRYPHSDNLMHMHVLLFSLSLVANAGLYM